MIEIHTDGSFIPEGKYGSWAFVVFQDGLKIHEASGRGENGEIPSSKAAEALAVEQGLKWVVEQAFHGQIVCIKTDCRETVKLIMGQKFTQSKTLAPIISRILDLLCLFDNARISVVWRGEILDAHILARAELASFRKIKRDKERAEKRIQAPDGTLVVEIFASLLARPIQAGAWAFVIRDASTSINSKVHIADTGIIRKDHDLQILEAISQALLELRNNELMQKPIWITTTSKKVVELVADRWPYKTELEEESARRVRELGSMFQSLRLVPVDGKGVKHAARLARQRMKTYRDLYIQFKKRPRGFSGFGGGSLCA